MVTALLLALAVVRNPTLTPGVVRPLSLAQVCGTRWGHDRRFVTRAMKQHVFAAYGIPWAQHAQYEVDHFEPRSLGGADVVANLWPQPWPEAHEKDRREVQLHRDVCAGRLSLAAAQAQMRAWHP